MVGTLALCFAFALAEVTVSEQLAFRTKARIPLMGG
jgi:hypothetical protein